MQWIQEEWVIQVNDELKQFEDSSRKEMEEQHWKKRSIHRLPECVTDLNKKAYMPKVISFGPYHHGQAHLQPMEEHKYRALLLFLKRSNTSLKVYVESLALVIQDLKGAYDSLDVVWQQDTNTSLQLMILDGCFMLEIFHNAANNSTNDDDDDAPNNPIFSDHGKVSCGTEMGKLVKEEWVIKINNELKQIEDISTEEMEQYWKKRSIYRLPACVTDQNKKAYNAYKPQAVSFGPYHHGQKHLQPMEEHKHRALLQFLKRSNKPLECYIESLAPVVQDLKDAYNSLDAAWKQDTDAFLQLMILDGCFMLEILHKAARVDDSHQAWKSSNRLSLDDDDYASNDPVFSNHGKLYIMPYIKRDMLMIENQLPMILLHNLLSVQNDTGKHEEKFIDNLILKFYSTSAPVSSMGKCLHVLDLYRNSLLFEDHHKKSRRPRLKTYSLVHESNCEIIRSAMELNEAGIKFRKSKSESLKDISFHRGVLRLPRVVVDDATESMFLNLMAFERFHVGAGNEVTSYIFFMDNIIDNAKDVTLLNSQGIIQNAIGSDKAVAKLFNSLSKDITIEPDSSLDIVHKNVNNYCRKPWNEWRANLIHTYFRNPWAILSVVATIFLFALTIIQTIYSVFPYYKSG